MSRANGEWQIENKEGCARLPYPRFRIPNSDFAIFESLGRFQASQEACHE